jgi:Signal peptidase (SPase) II
MGEDEPAWRAYVEPVARPSVPAVLHAEVPVAPPKHLVERLLAFGALALSLAAADMAAKEYLPTPDIGLHQRSFAWALGSIVLIAAAVPLLRLPSWSVAIAAGVMAGGTLGNLVSALVYGGHVPNPILIGDYDDRGIAFNLADLFTFFGILALTVSLVVVSIRHRDRLLPPRAWERRIWDKLGL